MKTLAALLGLATLLSLSCSGCVTPEPLDGTSFRVDLRVRGAGKRSLRIEVTPETKGVGLTRLQDATSPDDDFEAIRRIKIATPWTEALKGQNGKPAAAPNPSPSYGDHIEVSTYAARPIELVFEYRGHTDVYHLTFPHSGGASLEPESGEFTHIYMKVP